MVCTSLSGGHRTAVSEPLPRPARAVFEALEPRRLLDSTVVFNEIMYNPPGDTDETLEWLELHNQLAVDMDISEWAVEGGIEYKFPDQTVVPGRGYLVVAISPAALEAATGFADALGPFDSGRLSNGGEELRLVNNDGRLMDEIDYNDKGEYPVGPDGGGASLAKIRSDTPSEPGAMWTFSPQIGGTPGAENFPKPGAFVTDTLLATGAAATALVPTDGSLELDWIELGFDDSSWLTGTTGVGYDNSTTYDAYFGLDLDVPPGEQTPMPMYNVNQSVYVRVEFDVPVGVDVDDYDSLLLRMRYDDGYVAWLNGQEVESENAPGRDGDTDPLLWNSGATGGHSDGEAVNLIDFDITGWKHRLNEGGANVLAIQGLNRGLGSTDLLISPEIVGRRLLPVAGDVVAVDFNEIAEADAAAFWVEIVNQEDSDVQIGGFELTNGVTGGRYVFPARTLTPGELLLVTEAELGFRPVSSDKLYLYTPNQEQMLDARPASSSLRGLSDRYPGQWLCPSAPTPGQANTFGFHDEIVINEIMYHAYPQLATATEPFADSPEEWIELYNRGPAAVDLGDWELDDAVRYVFEAGTILHPGEYLVVTDDAAGLSARYPAVDIVGDFAGSLSNRDDRVLLLDASGNPADEVHYYERGDWPEYADGGGSSLELRNPRADNSKGAAWAASDESPASAWVTHVHEAAATEPLEVGTVYNELIFGLMDSGEFYIDDISVIRDPYGSAAEMMQNGSFESDAIGSPPAAYRLIGTHSGTVQVDPSDPSNRVLHVVAAGPQQFVHDHVETTFTGNTALQNGQTYRISYRAKWVGGNGQLNSRLYFTRMSNTAYLDVPADNGTPGARNSRYEANLGPTYDGFGHRPVFPSNAQAVTVSVEAADPDGVASMTLWYNADASGWRSVAMTTADGASFSGVIPAQPSGDVVRFYVEGVDGLGLASTFPAAGRQARAQYQVDDGKGTSRPVDTVRLVLTSADNSSLFSAPNKMSNNYHRGTLIYNESEAFYDIEIRQVGSRFVRPNSGYKVRLNPNHRFYGVHDSIRFDLRGPKEIYMKQMVNRAGGSSVSLYDDVAYLISPQHGQDPILLQLARYTDVFLEEQFADGGDGMLFELDDITYPTNPNPAPEGLKTGTGVSSPDMNYRGPSKEAYRGHLLIKNNRTRDDFDGLIAMSRAMDYSGQMLLEQTNAVMDVDLWMRHYATQAFLGNWDTYGFRRPKNLRIYVRPSDGMVMPLYWDADLANLTDSLIYNGGATSLDEIRNLPANLRLFWGHMWDLVDRAFNDTYIGPWIDHFETLTGQDYGSDYNKMVNRTVQARNEAQAAVPQVGFAITTNGGNDFSADELSVTIEGSGWINVREIRLAGSDQPLELTWTSSNTWQVTLPLEPGENVLAFEAYGFRGQLLATDDITVDGPEPPRVIDVVVSSTAWPQTFLDELAAEGLGEGGYSVPVGSDEQFQEIPWNNIDRIRIAFSERAFAAQTYLGVYGAGGATYSFSSFQLDLVNFTATWTLAQPVAADKLLLVLSDSVRDFSMDPLDGEWTDGVGTYPSGDGTAGGNFEFRLNILPGDVDQSGDVRSSDVIKARRKGNTAVGDAEYSPLYDVDGSGEIRSSDVIKVRRLSNTQLPDGEPTLPPPAASGIDPGLIAAALAASQSETSTDPLGAPRLDVLSAAEIVPLVV